MEIAGWNEELNLEKITGLSIQLDNLQKELQALCENVHTTKHGEPMQIRNTQISHEEKEHRRNQCFFYGKADHRVRQCPSPHPKTEKSILVRQARTIYSLKWFEIQVEFK